MKKSNSYICIILSSHSSRYDICFVKNIKKIENKYFYSFLYTFLKKIILFSKNLVKVV